jgi:ABC-2 type transport system ATP-binding protein
MTPVIEANNIEKHFDIERPLHKMVFAPFAAGQTVCALKDVSFCVDSGQILGVVGPNGAGKTTLLRILANLLEADGGRIKLCGHELNGEPYLRTNIGYVSSDERSFFWRLTGRQNLEFFAGLYGINMPKARKRITKLITLFNLEEKSNQLFRDYSTGTRKKFALARALIHQPGVLLLDEVTNSLDVDSAQRAKFLVREYIRGGNDRAAIWSTHRFEEIEQICDKVLVIDKGRVTFFGNAADFKRNNEHKSRHQTGKIPDEELSRSLNAAF